MTYVTRALLVPALVATLVAEACACEDAYTGGVATCIEIEGDAETAAQGFVGLPDEDVTGARVADDGLVAANFVECGDALRHSVTVDGGAGLGRVRFSWGREGVDLDVDIADGEITVEQITTNSWVGGSAFVIRDSDGLALAVDAASALRTVGDARFEHGFWRGSTPSGCGISSATGTRITVGDVSHDVSNRDVVAIQVDGNDMRFHPFKAITLGPVWVCTDSSNSLNWALVRDST